MQAMTKETTCPRRKSHMLILNQRRQYSNAWGESADVFTAMGELRLRDGARYVPERVVTESGWRAQAANPPPEGKVEGWPTSEIIEHTLRGRPDTPDKPDGQARENQKRSARRALRTLKTREIAMNYDGWVWRWEG